MPQAFTEQGIAPLNVDSAIDVNIGIMKAFVQIRKISSSQEQLAQRLQEIEMWLENHDESIEAIFVAIRQLMTPREKPRKKIEQDFRLAINQAAGFPADWEIGKKDQRIHI